MTLAAPSLPLAILLYLAVALTGLGAGVVINILADGVAGDEEPPWRARDCRVCGNRLPARRMVPLLGLRTTRRTCATCGTRASLRRPLLELALALISPLLLAHLLDPTDPRASTAHLAPVATFALDAVLICVLAFIFAVDLEHRLILDLSIYPAIALLLLVALLFNHKAFAAMLFGVVIFGGLFLLLYVLGFVLYRQEALGFGDVKLAVLVGMLVGWPAIGTALVLTAVFGGSISLLLLALGSATRRTFIPFGIFIVIGAVLALLLAPPYW